MARLDQERQKRLEPKRLLTAVKCIEEAKCNILSITDNSIVFEFKNEKVLYFPYSGWHTGKSIEDGRGLNNLLKQIQK